MIGDSLSPELKQKKLQDLKRGLYKDQIVTIMPGYKISFQLQQSTFPSKAITKPVKQLVSFLHTYYYEKLKSSVLNIDVQKQALKLVQQEGIIFLDQIDKLAVSQGSITTSGKGVSTEGVQRDLLPILQGTTVSTKFGDVKTDHILFIASGSFSMAKVEDLIPQLLGRLPIRVNLVPLSKQQLVRILKQPKYNLIFQQSKLLSSQKVTLKFTDDAINEIAQQAYQINTITQNLGARRLHSIIEKIVQEISFTAHKHKGQTIQIDVNYVRQKLKNEVKSIDLSKFLI